MTNLQFLRKTNEMVINASSHRIKNLEEQTFKLLITGFTRSLKGWWDNNLILEQKHFITTSVKTENGQQIPIMVEILIITIIHNFMGDSNTCDAKTSNLLHNLRCPTLRDFR
uniref:DUF7746 domain-containing protein n=1 Tax=Cajanus cajan TaxID=3821 RepID=A0A151QUC3_CAJCA|nr:hypothetical protein KK1_045250 [Cajanus cajan]